MPWKIYKGDCPECGQYAERFLPSRQGFRCQDCGDKSARRAAYEMATKQGPAWEAFLLSRGASGRPPSTK